MFVFAHLNDGALLPDFTGFSLAEAVLHESARFGSLGVSAGNFFGQVGLDIMAYFFVKTTVWALRAGWGVATG